ncbi:bifunctional diguanylate cyclase/phosphodiesterase [Aquisalimonas lutea]|uniref:bifunctional diguanylate cyclase/phosphodiesterase n=1 Tax=Aquisalimonas lutea TaxID=1327750 RepID=UPI0025B570B5|nr:bifunctional diguanylate cyclase/phosphodiesterase [Aquisalimonas lutea]MDN3516936.1 bifunctional diguanylate cyclase/phosphodiesterase [Aquisalimonas lutea]
MSTSAAATSLPRLTGYQWFSRLPVLRHSFKAKVLVVAFLGTHVPLLAILAYFIYANSVTEAYALQVLAMALVATLAGTLVTLVALHALLRPIDLTLGMLRRFRERGQLYRPELDLRDEMGTLIQGTHRALEDLGAHLERVATRDHVTGVLNAHGLEQATDRLREAGDASAALVLVRVRNYGQLEVTLEREELEFVTRTLADRLRLVFPEPALIAVRGRGEFAVLLDDTGEADVEARSNHALSELTAALQVRGSQIGPICALGVARLQDAGTPHGLLPAAEAAVMAAEECDGSSWVLSSEAGAEQRTRMELSMELGRALERDELFPVYQGRIDTRTGQVVGVEALVRWRHPQRGTVSPGLFIPVAERTGQILAIGRQMLDRAVAQGAAWERQGQPLVVSVNVAALQIAEATLFDDVRDSLRRHGLTPGLLELEITESALLQRSDASMGLLERVRGLGVSLALDDFGTGYSSLSYLTDMPVDRVKIDRSFVARLPVERDRRILEGIVHLAAALGLAVTAEGVETGDQARILRDLGCDQWQGFLFARPVEAGELDRGPHTLPG